MIDLFLNNPQRSYRIDERIMIMYNKLRKLKKA